MNRLLGRRRTTLIGLICGLVLVITGLGTTLATAVESQVQEISLLACDGIITAEDASGNSTELVQGDTVDASHDLVTGKESTAVIGLGQGRTLYVDADSRVAFVQENNGLKLVVHEGKALLDVQEKLGNDETLTVSTPTMDVDIRGTIVFVEDQTNREGTGSSTLGVLEGTARVSYQGLDDVAADAPAGQMTTVRYQERDEGTWIKSTAQAQIAPNDLDGFYAGVIQDAGLSARVSPIIDDNPGIVAHVTLIAQSVSKIYDGKPLTKPNDVVVLGLPGDYTIDVAATGSQTDAGQSQNLITGYRIIDAQGTDATDRFDVTVVNGILSVDRVPITVWTGSGEKTFDGSPLRNEEAKLLFGSERFSSSPSDRVVPAWRDSAYAIENAVGQRELYGLCGETTVVATNPLTGENREFAFTAGQRLTIALSDQAETGSLVYQVADVKEDEIPELILRIFTDNQELLSQACQDAGWDKAAVERRIGDLPMMAGVHEEPVLLHGIVNAQICIDSEATDYANRALGADSVAVSNIAIDDSITVTATGSQTTVGSSTNTYRIDWGTANPKNYALTEQLGTLTVTAQPENNRGAVPVNPNPTPKPDPQPKPDPEPEPITTAVTFTAGSASKVYDGSALNANSVLVEGLPQGYTYSASCSGNQTDAGTSPNEIQSVQILDADGNDATARFTNLSFIAGTLTVTPAAITIETGSAEKAYDGEPLSCDEVSITGLVDGDTVIVTTTGTIIDVGSVDNAYSIDWGATNASNYTVSENPGTLAITPLEVSVQWTADGPLPYSGFPYEYPAGDCSLTYVNGTHAGETVAGISNEEGTSYLFALFTGDEINGLISAFGQDAGTYPVTTEATITVGKDSNYIVFCSDSTFDIIPADLIAVTDSAEKTYDGEPLTTAVTVYIESEGARFQISDEGRVGFGSDEFQLIAASITDAVAADATYTVDWGDANPSNYAIADELGSLAIYPAPLTITTGSASKLYDGSALTCEDIEVLGLASCDAITAMPNGAISQEGTAVNTYTIDWGSTNQDNYSITDNLGTLTVARIYITASSAEKNIDGAALVSPNYTIEGVPFGWDVVDVVVEGSQTAGGSSPNVITHYTLLNPAGQDVTDDYPDGVVCTDGILTVIDSFADRGVSISQSTMKLIFPDEEFSLRCSYKEALHLAISLSRSEPSLDDVEFQALVKNQFTSKGWI